MWTPDHQQLKTKPKLSLQGLLSDLGYFRFGAFGLLLIPNHFRVLKVFCGGYICSQNQHLFSADCVKLAGRLFSGLFLKGFASMGFLVAVTMFLHTVSRSYGVLLATSMFPHVWLAVFTSTLNTVLSRKAAEGQHPAETSNLD